MSKKISQKEQQDKLVQVLKKWQKVEDMSVEMSERTLRKTNNTLIRLILEILRSDSVMHKKVQQFIIDSLTKKPVKITPEDLAEIWDSIHEHDEAELEAIKLGEEALRQTKSFVPSTLLEYLIEDEKKHDRLIGHLEEFKSRIYPY